MADWQHSAIILGWPERPVFCPGAGRAGRPAVPLRSIKQASAWQLASRPDRDFCRFSLPTVLEIFSPLRSSATISPNSMFSHSLGSSVTGSDAKMTEVASSTGAGSLPRFQRIAVSVLARLAGRAQPLHFRTRVDVLFRMPDGLATECKAEQLLQNTGRVATHCGSDCPFLVCRRFTTHSRCANVETLVTMRMGPWQFFDALLYF